MSAMRWKRKVILAKVEGTYGTDSTPAAATDAILARNVAIDPLELNYDQREFVLPWFGTFGKIPSGGFVKISFEVEAAGSAAAGTAPAYGPLLKACGMGETIVGATSVTYAPVSTEGSVSMYMYIDGRLHKILGALGTCKLAFNAGKVPVYQFSFIGLFAVPTDIAIVTPTLTAYIKPVAVNKVNTTPATLFTYSAKFVSLVADIGNVLTPRQYVNDEAVGFVDRKTTGQVAIEDELIAAKDWWTIVKNGTTGALAFTHGTVAANKIQLNGPVVQLTEPKLSESNGISILTMNMEFIPSNAGNDEFSIVYT